MSTPDHDHAPDDPDENDPAELQAHIDVMRRQAQTIQSLAAQLLGSTFIPEVPEHLRSNLRTIHDLAVMIDRYEVPAEEIRRVMHRE